MTRGAFLQILAEWQRGEGPLYQRLAAALRAAIERGDVTAGARLPAQRVLARWLEVSRTTVVMAYDALAGEGWLEGRQGSGTTVRRAASRALATRAGAAAVLSTRNVVFRGLVERSGAEIEFMSATFNGPPQVFDEAYEAARTNLAKLVRGHGYLPLGLPDLRAAIAGHLGRSGLPTRAEQVLVTSGAQQAIALIANLIVDPGDPVLLEDPTYLGAIDAFASFGARLSGVPIGPEGLSAEALRAAVARTSPRVVYLMPTCHNPTGAVLDEPARRAAMRALEGSGAVVVEDMTLADLTLEPRVAPPLAAFARDATVLTVGSLSKLFWGGLRVGWIRGPEPMIARLSRLKVVSDLSGSLVSQAVATQVLARASELVALRRRQVRTGLERATRLLAAHLPDWKYPRPAGGLSLWVAIPAGDVAELARVALRRGVAIVPGTVNSPEGRWSDHLRLPFVGEPAAMEEGVRRIAAAWAEVAPERRAKRQGVGVLV
ncbi:MAG TPA: PLP-dependent aminotransferase family protein [Candidatus Eisenbacteria bacterium]